MSTRRPGWFANCTRCDFGFEVIELGALAVPDPDEAEESIHCPNCGDHIVAWSQI